MSAVKTYILAPNFTYHPNTSIRMGDIIQYADDPTKPLNRVPEFELKPTTEHNDYKNELGDTDKSSLRGSIWATFLEKVSAKVGGSTIDQLLAKYTIERLQTIYFTEQPTDEEAEARVLDKKVKAAINAGILCKKPVFMITGLKVARGFKQVTAAKSSKDAEGHVAAPIMENGGLGIDINYSQEKRADHKHETEQDIIFAYQVHIITYKGWFRENISIDVYKAPMAAGFLHQDKKEEELVEVGAANEMLLRKADEKIKMAAVSAKDGNEDCVCIVFSQE
ncbi:hypothetical protein GQX73_g1325 [Xylaria multiplex]|uniref:Uncharacterized protein n=1 Tax=Xylaria multiplex TaxID=323545 RepID=A0A7C8IU15_9PEZI|nr:hypothetical protein GQX73_g1325 [Xylaria multiplex]